MRKHLMGSDRRGACRSAAETGRISLSSVTHERPSFIKCIFALRMNATDTG